MRVTVRIERADLRSRDGAAAVEATLYGPNVGVCCEAVRAWGYEVSPLAAKKTIEAVKRSAVSEDERVELLAQLTCPDVANSARGATPVSFAKGLLFE